MSWLSGQSALDSSSETKPALESQHSLHTAVPQIYYSVFIVTFYSAYNAKLQATLHRAAEEENIALQLSAKQS